MLVYLIRHTKVAVPKGTCYGQSNVSLAKTADKDIEVTLQKCPKHFDILYSSPLDRCLHLARKLSPHILIDDRLREINMGTWELKSYDEIGRDKINLWLANLEEMAAPKGENYTDLYKRVISFYREIESQKNEKTLIVAHDGIIRCIFAYIFALRMNQTKKLKLNYGSVSKIYIEDGVSYLEEYNC